MRKILFLLLIAASLSSHSEGIRHEGFREHREGGGWFAPMIIGGVIGYELSRPRDVIIQQPVIVQPQPVYAQPPVGYHWQQIVDPVCNCYKMALVPN